MKILLVNERGYRSQWLAHFIRRKDGVVDVAGSLADMEDALAAGAYDVLLVDLDHGVDLVSAVVQAARRNFPELRLLVLARRESIADVAAILDRGADDFILKPFEPEELQMRLNLLASVRAERVVRTLECGALKLDLTTREVSLDEISLALTPRERSVLEVLISHCGSLISKGFIASRIFSLADEVGLENIEVYVHRLRRKLAHADVVIRTVRGLGYVLEPGSMEAIDKQKGRPPRRE